jgi:hypothetical protein
MPDTWWETSWHLFDIAEAIRQQNITTNPNICATDT